MHHPSAMRLFLQSCFLHVCFAKAADHVPWSSSSKNWLVAPQRCSLEGRLASIGRRNTWGLTTQRDFAVEIRGGAMNSTPEGEEEEEYDEDEEEDDDEHQGTATADEENNMTSLSNADIEIEVPDEEEWNKEEQAVEEAAGADIQVMVEMETESEEVDNRGSEPILQAIVPSPMSVESTLAAESFTPVLAADNDGDSSAFVDRMELADAYDEGETTSFEHDANAAVEAAPVAQDDAAAPVTPPTEAAAAPEAQVETYPVETKKEESPDATPVSEETSVPEPPQVEPTEKPVAAQDASADSQQATNAAASDDSSTSAAAATAPQVMTDVMKDELRKLGYSRDDISRMKPSVAAIAIDKQLQKPTEGLPNNWYLPGKKKSSSSRGKLTKIVAKIVLPLLAAGLALKGGMELHLLSSSSGADAASSSSSESFRPMTAADMAYYSSIISEATGKGNPAASRQRQ
ncbi:hypothetical protein MPSEU_000693400 [Mayamaea pseudoterrestris]|nr:hypothetical protein MPSEU_000693400 [Mayamaea pseudoterrestris]